MKIYKFIYSNINKTRFKITKQNFLKKNKYKYKIIYKNKIYSLQGKFEIIKNDDEKIKFKLICYNKIPEINNIIKYDHELEYSYEVEKYKKIWICINLLIIFLILLMK